MRRVLHKFVLMPIGFKDSATGMLFLLRDAYLICSSKSIHKISLIFSLGTIV